MNADDFRERMAALPDQGQDAPIFDWEHHRHAIREAVVLHGASPEELLTWPTIRATMVVRGARFSGPEYNALVEDGRQTWLPAIRAPFVCGESPAPFNRAVSETLVHQAHHLMRWQKVTGLRVTNLDSILEVGGGYGAMAVVCRQLGFRGRYVIYDVPEVLLCAQYYLERAGQYHAAFATVRPIVPVDFCIACWSVTELYLHQRWMPDADNYLVAYHDRCDEIDNAAWLKEWSGGLGESYQWHTESVSDIGYYLFGWRTA